MHKIRLMPPIKAELSLAILLLGMFLMTTASAHHSRSNYDMQTFLEYDGKVVEFSWSNPHAFAVIEIQDEAGQPSQLLLEMNSKIILRGMGWTEKP